MIKKFIKMTTDKTVLDIIFLYVFSERYYLINEDLVYIASSEWEHVWKYVKPLRQDVFVDDSKITKFLFAVGNSLQSQSWNYAKRVGIEAESQYNKLRKLVPLTVIQPFLLKNNQESKPDSTIPKINFHQPHQLGVVLMAPQKPEYLVSDVVNKKASGRDSTLTDHEIRSFDKESIMIVNKVTSLREFCSPKEIVDELSSVFKKEWRAAFEHCQVSNDKGDTIKFLRDILKVSYGMVCRPITEAQLVLMQREALRIISGSNRVTTEFPDRTILEDYRRQYASLSLRYVKENLFERHMHKLMKKYNIIYKNLPVDEENVDVFAAKCVEITWFMCVQNPPMVFQFEVNSDHELQYVFRNFQEHGFQYDYTVWPAIRLSENGTLLNKGYAMFH